MTFQVRMAKIVEKIRNEALDDGRALPKLCAEVVAGETRGEVWATSGSLEPGRLIHGSLWQRRACT